MDYLESRHVLDLIHYLQGREDSSLDLASEALERLAEVARAGTNGLAPFHKETPPRRMLEAWQPVGRLKEDTTAHSWVGRSGDGHPTAEVLLHPTKPVRIPELEQLRATALRTELGELAEGITLEGAPQCTLEGLGETISIPSPPELRSAASTHGLLSLWVSTKPVDVDALADLSAWLKAQPRDEVAMILIAAPWT